MVGYCSVSTFRGLLGTFLGMPASRYRRQARRRLARAGPLPAGSDSDAYWQRMQDGELSDGEARELDRYLARLAPDAGAAPRDSDERWRRLRETLADGFVVTLRHLVHAADRRRFARDAVCFPDRTFFERLSRESREVAATDPDKAVEWALLAVDSLAANRMLGSDPALASLAWARLALARWRAGDLAGARKDFEQSAEDEDRTPPAQRFAPWTAERLRAEGAFHWHRGRRTAAMALAEESVVAYRAAGAPAARARALALRAELRAALADLESPSAEKRAKELRGALEDLDAARGLDAAAPLGGLRTRLLVLLRARNELAAVLTATRAAAGDDGDGDSGDGAPRLLWLEGHAIPASDGAAEPLWRRARNRYEATGDGIRVAGVPLQR